MTFGRKCRPLSAESDQPQSEQSGYITSSATRTAARGDEQADCSLSAESGSSLSAEGDEPLSAESDA